MLALVALLATVQKRTNWLRHYVAIFRLRLSTHVGWYTFARIKTKLHVSICSFPRVRLGSSFVSYLHQ